MSDSKSRFPNHKKAKRNLYIGRFHFCLLFFGICDLASTL
ncbi:MAG: hypothetical protein JWR72_2301 [Flavisolibacter sp.]|jgi:hypothetical protein|nr:hypothetical protein [Flavisolibacter sp.]